MNRALRLTAAIGACALAACTKSTAPTPGANFNEPSAAAIFRGVTVKSGLQPPSAPYPYRPYLAVANAGGNSISLVDPFDGKLVDAPMPLRGVVYPVPGRPVLLASADLGDRRPDLLVVVTAGDLPWLGGSRLEVVRTWAADGGLVQSCPTPSTCEPVTVDLGLDVLSLVALPPDPAGQTATLVAALADERLATVTFQRVAGGDAIDVAAAQATVAVSARLGFQPLALAALPGDRTRVFAATSDPLPGGVSGVAELSVIGTPAFSAALDARAPTRLVTAMHLAEALPVSVPVGGVAADASAFTGQAPVDRVYAVLDESGCGLHAGIACGLVALDPVTRGLLPDPIPASSIHVAEPFLAPIPVGYALGVGASGPPSVPPSAAEPQYAGTYMKVPLSPMTRATTAVGGVASSDGYLSFIDLARWDVPPQTYLSQSVGARWTSTRPTGAAGPQWLVLFDPWHVTTTGAPVRLAHDPAGVTTGVIVTPGFTPNDTWVVTREGKLPGLTSRRAEVGVDGEGRWLALQSTGSAGIGQVVRLWDPTLGVTAGDIVVIDATGLGTCTKDFEASVDAVLAPTTGRPGGYVRLGYRTTSDAAGPTWNACVDAMVSGAARGAHYLATIRAGDYVLVRGLGAAEVHVGRPKLGERFEVRWQDEGPLAAACTLPPSVPWTSPPPACDAACRGACELLQRVRLARRIGYARELPAGVTGPALAFTLALEAPTQPIKRDLALAITTADGRSPFRVTVPSGSAVDARSVLTFDASPWSPGSGLRFLVPYAGNTVLNASPDIAGGGGFSVH